MPSAVFSFFVFFCCLFCRHKPPLLHCTSAITRPIPSLSVEPNSQPVELVWPKRPVFVKAQPRTCLGKHLANQLRPRRGDLWGSPRQSTCLGTGTSDGQQRAPPPGKREGVTQPADFISISNSTNHTSFPSKSAHCILSSNPSPPCLPAGEPLMIPDLSSSRRPPASTRV